MLLLEKIISALKNYMVLKENIKFVYLFGSFAEGKSKIELLLC
ncbi:nucleotidyltransferase domain-containing protein [Thermovenabulum gondwanense]|uniref:Polymerase beta nucleotidyltransferase domain-containing protein n=1 Tax=Thermovenabulum gondwanense TaxID=520767 RepID=A0A161PYA8_9FIRM|nr:nucleotidyltransferase domain-containing protein [Thermovenabulum gondwanense]KYO67004.1 hypothetical protein ATZ99_08210 [Thermovenabulum gondwanense]